MTVPRSRGDERRTIKELVLRYELHPELGDVYVEGGTDEAFIEWFLMQNERRDWYVYPIDTVNVPADLVYGRDLEVSERGEVLTLGMELSERLQGVPCRKPVCIADSDTLALDEREINCDLCLLTDFTSMEMYAFNTKTLDKFLRMFVQTDGISAIELMEGISAALTQLFVVRVVFHRWKNGIGVLNEFTRCCEKGDFGVELDVRDLITRSLQPTARKYRPALETIIEEVDVLRSKVPNDIRLAIRGHDFIDLMVWFLDGYGVPTELRNKKVVHRALYTSLEMGDLIEYPMFAELLNRTVG